MCVQSIKLNSIITNSFKVVLMGEGSKILNNQYKNDFFTVYDLDLIEKQTQDVCRAGLTLGISINRKEVTVVPKKLIKRGFFEKFFHFFG